MKKFLKLGTIFMLAIALTAGCGIFDGKKDTESEAEQTEKLYPVTINGKEIRVGETTVQTLLDEGLKLTVSEMTTDNQINTYEIDPETELEANTYYTGGSISITDSIFAHVSFITGDEAIRMGDAVVAYVELSLTNGEAEDLEQILLDGVPVSEISREKAGEMFPEFTGDDNMLLQYGSEYKYVLGFASENHMLSSVSLEKKYDVDWTGNN